MILELVYKLKPTLFMFYVRWKPFDRKSPLNIWESLF